MRQQSYENKHFNNILANRVLKVKNSPLELEQYFKPINVSIDNMDKFKEKEVTKKWLLAKKHLIELVLLVNYL